jgi:glycine/serine hydroxymethyltransferase
MAEDEMATVARLIGTVLRSPGDATTLAATREEVATLCSKFTPYP